MQQMGASLVPCLATAWGLPLVLEVKSVKVVVENCLWPRRALHPVKAYLSFVAKPPTVKDPAKSNGTVAKERHDRTRSLRRRL